MGTGLAPQGKEQAVHSRSNWNPLEYFKPDVNTMNLGLKDSIRADARGLEQRGCRGRPNTDHMPSAETQRKAAGV